MAIAIFNRILPPVELSFLICDIPFLLLPFSLKERVKSIVSIRDIASPLNSFLIFLNLFSSSFNSLKTSLWSYHNELFFKIVSKEVICSLSSLRYFAILFFSPCRVSIFISLITPKSIEDKFLLTLFTCFINFISISLKISIFDGSLFVKFLNSELLVCFIISIFSLLNSIISSSLSMILGISDINSCLSYSLNSKSIFR